MAFTLENMADFQLAIERDKGRGRVQSIAQTKQKFFVARNLLQKERMLTRAAKGLQFNLNLSNPSTGNGFKGLAEKDTYPITDLLQQMQVDFCYYNDAYSWNEIEYSEMGSERALVDIGRLRRNAMLLRGIEYFETHFLETPVEGDKNRPYGLKFWLPRHATEGFNGGLPGGVAGDATFTGTTKCGITLASYPNFYSRTGTYNGYNWQTGGLFLALYRMFDDCEWEIPIDVQDYRTTTRDVRRILTNQTVIQNYIKNARTQNDNIGFDAMPIDGNSVVYNRHPIVRLRGLDADTYNPVYMVDMSTFHAAVHPQFFMRETPVAMVPGMHLWWHVQLDCYFNYVCVDPRRNGVIYLSA